MQAVPRSLSQNDAAPPPTRPGLSPFPRPTRPSPEPSAGGDLLEMPVEAGRRARPDRFATALRLLRLGRRFVLVMGWTAIAGLVQSVMLMLPGRPKKLFARTYWSVVAALLGVRVRMVGRVATGRADGRPEAARRPVIFVCNHSSWLDVPVLGGRLLACFVAKEEVGRWPVVGTVARLGRTIFVSRQRKATGRERDDMRLRLAAGDDLILFPEGTSSDGSRVLPFHSSFFAAAKPNGGRQECPAPDCLANVPLIQPVSIVYDRLGGMPVGRTARTVFSWYGDMDLASHFARLARWKGMRATVLLHPVLDPATFGSRKALSNATWTAVAEGAAALRQNRVDDVPVKIAPRLGREAQPEAFLLDSDRPSFA